MYDKYSESIEYIRNIINKKYDIGIILGTGLGGLVKQIDIEHSIDYKDIPHFPVSTVESHTGKLIFGKLSGKNIVAMSGRFHFYEGYEHRIISYPVHILRLTGIHTLIVSNACGAINQKFNKADLMIMTSHINLHFTNPFINEKNGKDVSAMYYDKDLIEHAERIAIKNNIDIKKGCYATVQGPNLETRAEYRMMQKLGADTVGMSTVPEVLTAHKLGLRILALSIITDLGFPDTLKVAEFNDILASACIAEPKLVNLIKNLVKEL